MPAYFNEATLAYADITAGLAEVKRRAFLGTNQIDETFSRIGFATNQAAILTSARLQLTAAVVVPAGRTVNSITCVTGTTGASGTQTNQWFALVRVSDLTVLAKTVDDTTVAWASNAAKTLTITGGFTASRREVCYVGLVVVDAGVMPTLSGALINTAIDFTPRVCGGSTTGLTNPASLGATAASPAAASQLFYAYISS
jgi:hypothetical protein